MDAARTRGTPHDEQEQDDGDGEDPDAGGDPLAAHAVSAVPSRSQSGSRARASGILIDRVTPATSNES